MFYATLSLCLRRRRKGRGQSFEPWAFFFWKHVDMKSFAFKILCQEVPKKWNLGPDFDQQITIFSFGRMWLNYQMRGTKLHADADDPVLLCCQKHQVTATQGGDHTAEGWDARRQEGSKGLGEGATEQCSAFLHSFVTLFQGSLGPKMLWLHQVSCQEMRRICRQMKKERPDLRKARATCSIMQKPKGSKKVSKTSQLSEPQVRRCTRKKLPSCQAILSSHCPPSPPFLTQNSILSWTQELRLSSVSR